MSREEQRLQRAIYTPIVRYKKPVEEPFKPELPPLFPIESIEELEKIIPLPTPPRREAVTPTLTQEVKNRQYRNFTVDLSTAHTDLELGLRRMGVVADTMTIITADSAFNYRLNSAANDATPSSKGMSETEFEIEEIYITNSALTGTAIIRISWNPQLIRLK